MKIMFFIGSLTGGGAERVTANLSNYLSRGHEVSVLTMTDIEATYKVEQSVKIIPLISKNDKSNFIIKNLKRYFSLRKILKSSPADAYIVMLPVTINLLLSQRKLIKSPIIVSERCDPYTRYDGSYTRKLIMKYLYKKADGFVFQTDIAKSYYAKEIDVEGTVIPNAINFEFAFSTENDCKEKKIVSVGRLTTQKNFELLIRAFGNIAHKHLNYKLIIYGEGDLRKSLENLINDLKLNDRIKLPGYVNNISNELHSASLFVLSSDFEGMPNSLMEAMSLGVPCISTDCPSGGPEYLIENGVNGLLSKVGDLNELSQKMDFLLSNRKLANELGENAKLISGKLSYERIYNKWEEYIKLVTLNYNQ